MLGNRRFLLAIMWNRKQNIALARNKAIENAKGDFIAFIDDDEFPLDQWLLNHVQSFDLL